MSIENWGKNQTGGHDSEEGIVVNYPFDNYIIKVLLDEYGKFIEIIEISVNKDFRSIKQKIQSTDYIDVEDQYKEEE